ncbi:hypothetical protein BJX64DRAFT_283902 [Aspergillus heterothallicus]
MPVQSFIPRFLNRKDESEIQVVVSAVDGPGTARETLFSVEATAQDDSEDEFRLLLGVKTLDLGNRLDRPKTLRWIHTSNNEVEFNSFLRRALEAYGVEPQAQSAISVTKFFDRFLALSEQSAFRGGRLRTAPASTKVQFPGSDERIAVNFMAIPYFSLQTPQSPPKRTTSRAKQAVRRMNSHVKDIVHVPQLWILSIGEKFVATCSPTPLYDSQRSSIITRQMGQDTFPPTIRVTTSSGLVFCLERDKCGVWFEFLYRVQCIMSAAREASIDTRNWVYKLEADESPIDARRWRSLLQQHPENELLAIVASPAKSGPEPSTDKFIPELRYPSDVSEILTKRDQRVLEHNQRRMDALLDGSDSLKRGEYTNHPYKYVDPYYWPPDFVLKAARAQAKKKKEHAQSESETQAHDEKEDAQKKQPVFKWTVGKPSSVEKEAADEPDPAQRMKSLLAYAHHSILFLSGLRLTKLYNDLPLETKSSILSQIESLGAKHNVNSYILDLLRDFVRCLSDILDEFIDPHYDCIVKGKVWAAVHAVIETFRYGLVDSLLPFQIDMLSIPLEPALRQIRSIRDGLSGVASPSIPPSLFDAFIQLIVLLVDAASEASDLIAKIEHPSARPEAADAMPPPDSEPGWTESVSDASDNSRGRRYERGRRRDRDRDIRFDFDFDGDYDGDGDEEKFKHHHNPQLPFSPDLAVDQLFEQLSHAKDECCASFRSEEEIPSAPGLGTIVSLALQSVLRGHSTSKQMPLLDIGEVYATYTTSLQLEARNRPSKNLLLDINLLREELETVLSNLDQQLNLVKDLRTDGSGYRSDDEDGLYMDETDFTNFELLYSAIFEDSTLIDPAARVVLQEIQSDLQERKDVFAELIKRANILERQIVQRVDIIQEDHGKAILVFTIVSTIFLPLSFVSSYLGMNTADIRDMDLNQSLFWEVAVPVTVVVVAAVLVGAYNAGRILRFVSAGAL